MAHGVEPILPFDITLATFLVPDIPIKLSAIDLLTIRTRQLQSAKQTLLPSTPTSSAAASSLSSNSSRPFEKTIKNFDFKLGVLVFVRNSSIETVLGRKSKPRYVGPMAVIHRDPNGSYWLAKLDGAASKLRSAAFHLVPYYARSRTPSPSRTLSTTKTS
jgi:hypothetical protein